MLKKWLKIILDIIYPPKCPACRRQTGQSSQWCQECLKNIFAGGWPREIPPGKHAINYLDRCLIVCHYQGVVKNLILDMKYNKNRKNGVQLAYLLENSLKSSYQVKADFVVPVPLHARKLKERGFNQVEEIFRTWAGKENLIWLDCLERIRLTKAQWNLTLKERIENVAGAFALKHGFDSGQYFAGKSVLLVDDIFTSGNTTKECAHVLKKAQASRIIVLALAGSKN